MATEINNKKARHAGELAARVHAGDKSAESELIRLYSKPLMVMLRNRARDPELARDLFQESFLIVIKKLRQDGLRNPESFSAYLLQTARNLLHGERARQARRATYADSDKVERAAGDDERPEAAIARIQEWHVVEELLKELPARDRDLLLRYYKYEQDKAAICTELRLSHLHFNRVHYRARRRLAALIAASPLGAAPRLQT